MHLSTIVDGVGNFTNCTTFNTTLSSLNSTTFNSTLGSLLNSTLSSWLNSTAVNSTSHGNITITVNINDFYSRSRILNQKRFTNDVEAAKFTDNAKFIGKVVGFTAAFTAFIVVVALIIAYFRTVRPERFARKYVDRTRLPVYSIRAPRLTGLKTPIRVTPWGIRAYLTQKDGPLTKVRNWLGRPSRTENTDVGSVAIELPELPPPAYPGPPRYGSEDLQGIGPSHQRSQPNPLDADVGDQPPTFDDYSFNSHELSGYTTFYNNPHSGVAHYRA